jgi:biofilm PGA synthesis lipoprotein PgaB
MTYLQPASHTLQKILTGSFQIKNLLLLIMLVLALPARAAVVLQYHHVSDSTPPSTSISPKLFQQHMEYLAEQKFNVVPLTELVEKLKQGKPLPEKTVAITFDDAYESVYVTVFPVLKKRGWPFTLFINTQPIDQQKKLFVTWAQLKEMAEHGATLANHSTEHNHLLRLRTGETRELWVKRIQAEVENAEQRIEVMTGQSHRIFAYPYGEYDESTKALLKKLKFVAFGQQSGPLRVDDDLQALPRFPFGGNYGDMKDFITKVNTRPLPIKTIKLYQDARLKKPLDDVVLTPEQRPVMVLSLTDNRMLSRIQCFASGQGAIVVSINDQNELVVQAKQPLKAGRTRYNCTAATDTKGEFYWISQQWLTTGGNGKWLHEG